MTSLKQIEANRRNALKSTGPRTEEGKEKASRNAIRHGLTAETVIEPLEDPEDYKAFEQAITVDYEAETAVERELILRLANLLWRLRRATSIETSLMSMEHGALHECEPRRDPQRRAKPAAGTALVVLRNQFSNGSVIGPWTNRDGIGQASENAPAPDVDRHPVSPALAIQSDIARRFLRVTSLDHAVFERLSRYEMTLWRQARQTIFTLEAMRWRRSISRRPPRLPWAI